MVWFEVSYDGKSIIQNGPGYRQEDVVYVFPKPIPKKNIPDFNKVLSLILNAGRKEKLNEIYRCLGIRVAGQP